MRKHYQNEEIDTSQPAVPDTVSVALADLAGEMREVSFGSGRPPRGYIITVSFHVPSTGTTSRTPAQRADSKDD